MTEVEEIRRRARAAQSLSTYGGRPDAAESELKRIEQYYSSDVPVLLKYIADLTNHIHQMQYHNWKTQRKYLVDEIKHWRTTADDLLSETQRLRTQIKLGNSSNLS